MTDHAYVRSRCLDILKPIRNTKVNAEGIYKKNNSYVTKNRHCFSGAETINTIVFSEIILFINNDKIHIKNEDCGVSLKCGARFGKLVLTEGDIVSFTIEIGLNIEDSQVWFSSPTKVKIK